MAQTQSTYTQTGWEVYPKGLTEILLWVKQRYGDVPLYVTENGAAFYDPPCATDGRINDPLAGRLLPRPPARHPRRDRGRRRPARLLRLVADGQPRVVARLLRCGSGIVHVNFETQERTLEGQRAHFYAGVIASGKAPRSATAAEARRWPRRSRMSHGKPGSRWPRSRVR